MQLREHTPNGIEGRIVLLRKLIQQSIRDPEVSRKLALGITYACPRRDGTCELQAIWDFMHRNIRYTGDIAHYDTFQTARRTLDFRGGDCFPLAQKVIVRSRSTGQYELLSLGELRLVHPAYEALSYSFRRQRHEFQAITGFADKGEKPVFKARLSNGTDLVATEDHKFWALDGEKQQLDLVEVSLGEYRERLARPRHRKNRILQAARIPSLDLRGLSAAAVYLAGIYAAEGHSDDRAHTSISQCKPEVRARIETALTVVGESWRYQGARYNLRAGVLVDELRAQGTNSFNMRLPGRALSGSRETVRAVLEAYADGDGYRAPEARIAVAHTTSSDGLLDDARLGLLILGEPFGAIRGHSPTRKPIWRLREYADVPRVHARDARVNEILPGLRCGFVRSIVAAGREHVGCITVDENHNFFLADGTLVRNCDDGTVLIATLAMGNGFGVKCRITKNVAGGPWAHILPMVAVPKNAPSRWFPLDWTLGYAKFGAHPPQAGHVEFDNENIVYSPSVISPRGYAGW